MVRVINLNYVRIGRSNVDINELERRRRQPRDESYDRSVFDFDESDEPPRRQIRIDIPVEPERPNEETCIDSNETKETQPLERSHNEDPSMEAPPYRPRKRRRRRRKPKSKNVQSTEEKDWSFDQSTEEKGVTQQNPEPQQSHKNEQPEKESSKKEDGSLISADLASCPKQSPDVLQKKTEPVPSKLAVGERVRKDPPRSNKLELESTMNTSPTEQRTLVASAKNSSHPVAQETEWMDSLSLSALLSPLNDQTVATVSRRTSSPALSDDSKSSSHPKSSTKDLSQLVVGTMEGNETPPQPPRKDGNTGPSCDVDTFMLITRQRYFSVRSILDSSFPVPVIEEPPNGLFIPKGASSIDHKLQCTPCVSQGNQWDLSLPLEPSFSSNVWMSQNGRSIYWEAHVLKLVRSSLSSRVSGDKISVQQPLQHFPKPVNLLTPDNTKDGTKSVIRVGLRLEVSFDATESSRDDHVEMLGTLEEVMRMHCQYNVGPIPESAVAWLLLQAIRIVGLLHHCGVTHNDLGLDSFVLLRQRTSGNSDGNASVNDGDSTFPWFVQCVGLGAKSALLGRAPMGVEKESIDDFELGIQDGSGRSFCHRHWHFEHDLYSLANMAYMLLSGGVPMSWEQSSGGEYELTSKEHITGNRYLRGSLEWGELFGSLLNPQNPQYGAHCMNWDVVEKGDRVHDCHTISVETNSDKTPISSERLSDACRLVRSVAEMGGETQRRPIYCAPESPAAFFDKLMAHRSSLNDLPASEADSRFLVKLQGTSPHCVTQSDAKTPPHKGSADAANQAEPAGYHAMIVEATDIGLKDDMERDLELGIGNIRRDDMEKRQTECGNDLSAKLEENAEVLQRDYEGRLKAREGYNKGMLEQHCTSRLEAEKVVVQKEKREKELERRLQEMEHKIQVQQALIGKQEEEMRSLKNCHAQELAAMHDQELFLQRSNNLWENIYAKHQRERANEAARQRDSPFGDNPGQATHGPLGRSLGRVAKGSSPSPNSLNGSVFSAPSSSGCARRPKHQARAIVPGQVLSSMRTSLGQTVEPPRPQRGLVILDPSDDSDTDSSDS